MVNSTMYVNGLGQAVPEYSGPVIDTKTQDEADQLLRDRLGVVGADEGIGADVSAINALAQLQKKLESVGSLMPAFGKQLESLEGGQKDLGKGVLNAMEVAGEASKRMDEQEARLNQLPDLSEVAKQVVDIVGEGSRLRNDTATASAALSAAQEETLAVVANLQEQVNTLTGAAETITEGIRERAVSDVNVAIQSARAAVQTIIDGITEPVGIESITQEKPEAFSMTLTNGETHEIKLPIGPRGWRGAQGASQATMGGGGGASSANAGNWEVDVNLPASTTVQLKFNIKDRKLPSRNPNKTGQIQWRFVPTLDPTNWISSTTWLARSSVAESEFTVAAELFGTNAGGTPHPDLGWVVNPGTGDELIVSVTAPVAGRFVAVLLDVQGGLI